LRTLINSDENYKKVLHPNYQFNVGQVVWAVRNEMAITIEDVLARRIRLLFLDAQAAIDCAESVASILQIELKKSQSWKLQEIERFKNLAQGYLI